MLQRRDVGYKARMKTLHLESENIYPLTINSNARRCWSTILIIIHYILRSPRDHHQVKHKHIIAQ
jgi:hypothetical protein